MSKVLIDRELLERAVYHLELAYDAYAPTICDLSSVLSAPSGTPAMPVKAYYHEAPNEYGGLNKSVGLEVRKEFADAPLVLEADALARIACLEGEIAKRDWELAACRIAVENCELFRARIVELESRYQRDVYGLNNEGDPIGGDPAGGYANDNAHLRAELSAIKAQEPVAELLRGQSAIGTWFDLNVFDQTVPNGTKLYAAPVSEAKEQGVVMPTPDIKTGHGYPAYSVAAVTELFARLNAAQAAPAADAGLVDMYRHLQKVTPYRFQKIQDASITDGGDVMYFHKDRFDAALLADMAAHCAAKGVV